MTALKITFSGAIFNVIIMGVVTSNHFLYDHLSVYNEGRLMARRKRKLPPLTQEERLSPFPHHPRKPGIYVLYIDWPDKDTSCVPIYSLAYGAKKHLDIILDGLEWELVRDDDALIGIIDDKRWLVAENGIRVRCSRLQEILDHKYSSEEESWQMPPNRLQAIEAFRYGKAITQHKEPDSETPSETAKKARRAKRRSDAPKQPRKKREMPQGMITVAMIAESLNMLPREARARLRKASVAKPDLGWMWSEAEAEEIKELIADE